jgi:hypothetical protein
MVLDDERQDRRHDHRLGCQRLETVLDASDAVVIEGNAAAQLGLAQDPDLAHVHAP